MQKSLLFIPGPVAVSEPVLAAMAKPLINHRGPEYARLLHSIAERMQSIFATTGDVLLLGASGTGSLEPAGTHILCPGGPLPAWPPGPAVCAVSSRAWTKIKATRAPRLSFDLQTHKELFDKGERPCTPPASVAFALDVAIDLSEREGPRNVWARPARYTDALPQ